MLEKLIQILLLDRHLLISIKEEKEIKSYSIYLLHLYQEKSQWIIEGFDLKKKRRECFLSIISSISNHTRRKKLNKKRF